MESSTEILKRLVSIEKRIASLEKALERKTLEKAIAFDKMKGIPAQVGLRLKRVRPLFDDDHEIELHVEYVVDDCLIRQDANGNLFVDERIKAINELNLIPLEDMQKVREYIDKYFKK